MSVFINTNGTTHYCVQEMKVNIKTVQAPKEKEVKAVVAKIEKKEEAEEDVFKQKGNPLDSLPPTKFNLFDFKTLFVNHPDKR